jgi:hypothetical protein
VAESSHDQGDACGPLLAHDEFAAVIGRRGGKSKAMATLATYIAGLCDHRDALVPGERGVLLCVALDQRVAKIILDYAEASFERSPILKQLIANRTADALELTNGITLEVRPASFRKLRGPTYVAVIADELAFWYVDAAYANPDVEILNAVEPGLATRPADPGLQSTRAPRRVVGRIPPPLRSGWRPTHSRGSRYEPVAQSVFATARGRSRTGEGPCPRDGGVSRAVPHGRRAGDCCIAEFRPGL